MSGALSFWLFVSRLGEAQILLPAALVLAGWLWHREGTRVLAQRWLALIAVAALATTVTKVAFIGWGIGSAALDFTGVSGHAMFAAAVYPTLARLSMAGAPPARQRIAWLIGSATALLIAYSRIEVHAHSWSEVLAGLVVGGAVSAWAWRFTELRAAALPRVPLWLPASVALWLALTPVQAPASTTHDMVTRLALTLSHHDRPHTRWELLHRPAGR